MMLVGTTGHLGLTWLLEHGPLNPSRTSKTLVSGFMDGSTIPPATLRGRGLTCLCEMWLCPALGVTRQPLPRLASTPAVEGMLQFG